MRLFRRKKKEEEAKRHQKAYEMGEAFGKQLGDKVDAYFADGRWDDVIGNLLVAFKQRLETVYDEPDHEPKDVALVELEIFQDQIKKAQQMMWQELQDFLSDELKTAEEIGLVEPIADLIEHAIEPRLTALVSGAMAMYEQRLKEIESK